MAGLTPSPPRKRQQLSQLDYSERSGLIGLPSIYQPAPTIPSTGSAYVDNERKHHVAMTPFGAVCFHPGCMTKLGRGIHTVSEKTLREHFDSKQCYCGCRPDCTNLVRDLKQDLLTIQELVQKGGARADVLVERVLPCTGVTRTKGSYCINCGLVGKPSQLKKQHFTEKNTVCRIEHLRCNETIVKSSIIHKMKIPEEVVSLIRQGKFASGQRKDPREKPTERKRQSIEKQSCEPSGDKWVR